MKHTLHYESRGESGNIFWILGAASALISGEEARTMQQRAFKSGSYQEALDIIGEYVDLIDDSEE